MKAIVKVLTKKERKAIEGICKEIIIATTMMNEGSRRLVGKERELWDILNSLYPKSTTMSNRTFNYEDYELNYFKPSNKKEEYKLLKEKAIKKQDFAKAADYRDLERKEENKDTQQNP